MANCGKCGGIHFGEVAGNCPLSADYKPSKPWPHIEHTKAVDVKGEIEFMKSVEAGEFNKLPNDVSEDACVAVAKFCRDAT